MKLLITGASGQLGAASTDRFTGLGHEVVAVTQADLDVTRHDAVMAAVREARPEAIVNCAAYTDVDGAEDHQAEALDVNAFAVRSLARAAAEVGATLVHYSTDFVFAGTGSVPYTEADRPEPQSVYAASKLLGEWFAQGAPKHYVLRVESLFGGPATRSSVDKIIDALYAGREARVFVDRVVSPSYVEDVAMATEAILEQPVPHGLYHCVNTGAVTWFDLARELARIAGREAQLVPVRVADVTLRAARPQYCALSNAKLAAAGVTLPPWEDAMARYLSLRAARSAAR